MKKKIWKLSFLLIMFLVVGTTAFAQAVVCKDGAISVDHPQIEVYQAAQRVAGGPLKVKEMTKLDLLIVYVQSQQKVIDGLEAANQKLTDLDAGKEISKCRELYEQNLEMAEELEGVKAELQFLQDTLKFNVSRAARLEEFIGLKVVKTTAENLAKDSKKGSSTTDISWSEPFSVSFPNVPENILDNRPLKGFSVQGIQDPGNAVHGDGKTFTKFKGVTRDGRPYEFQVVYNEKKALHKPAFHGSPTKVGEYNARSLRITIEVKDKNGKKVERHALGLVLFKNEPHAEVQIKEKRKE